MFDFEKLNDSRTVVGDGKVAEVVHKHLVQANRAKGRLHDVGDRKGSGHWEGDGNEENPGN